MTVRTGLVVIERSARIDASADAGVRFVSTTTTSSSLTMKVTFGSMRKPGGFRWMKHVDARRHLLHVERTRRFGPGASRNLRARLARECPHPLGQAPDDVGMIGGLVEALADVVDEVVQLGAGPAVRRRPSCAVSTGRRARLRGACR